jgi:FkbM family methyltransferase
MTSSVIQRLVLGIYRLPPVQMLLRTRTGSSLFVTCYDFYKNLFEAPGSHALAQRIAPGSWVIDVGANNGFFTGRFARWVKAGGRVIAIEPDSENLALLHRRLSSAGPVSVDVHQAVAMERSGSAHLQRNPYRPDDHRIADTGDVVAAVTIDELVEQAGNPMIGLIKIDTQGSEPRVLAGASRTLQRCRPNLFIEICDAALRDSGTSAEQLVRQIQEQGYRFFTIARNGDETLMPADAVLQAATSAKDGYIDVLCAPAP